MNRDFKEILYELSAANAEFLVVGAHALAAHGLPRATGDIDIWINATPENAERVCKALAAFGAPMEQVSKDDFSTPGITFQMGLPPHRIDILTEIDSVTFQEAWADHITTRVDELIIPVIGREALLTNKKAVGRAKDIADIEALEAQ